MMLTEQQLEQFHREGYIFIPEAFSPEEVELMRRDHDAIERVRKALLGLGVSEQSLKSVDDEIKALVADAAEFAQTSPEPDPSELWTDILVEVRA